MSYYYNAAGQRFPLPERPLEPPDVWVKNEPPDDKHLAMEFAREHSDEFIDFVVGYDYEILEDFVESLQWK